MNVKMKTLTNRLPLDSERGRELHLDKNYEIKALKGTNLTVWPP